MLKKIILLSTIITTFNLISAEEKLKFVVKDFGSSSFNITIEELEKSNNASKIIIKGYRENDPSADGWVYCMKKRISLENNFKYVMEMNKPVELSLWKKLKSNFQMVEKPDQEIVIVNLKNETDDERFKEWAHILLDQAVLAEGGQLDDAASYVNRLNKLLIDMI